MTTFARKAGSDVLVRIKAVPGARSDGIVGTLGDRLKVRVSAPPEGGRANRAICRLLADALDLSARAVTVESGETHAEKTVRIRDCVVERVQGLASRER